MVNMKVRIQQQTVYQQLLNELFGKDAVKIKKNIVGKPNKVISALSCLGESCVFRENFRQMLVDLKSKYDLECIRNALADLALNNSWEGHYAELVAWNVLKTKDSGTIQTNRDLRKGMGFATEMGKTKTNEDGYWENFDAYFDAKVLRDPIKNILDGVIQRAENNASPKEHCSILPEYPLDDNDAVYSSCISQIEQELTTAIAKHKNVIHISCLHKLSFYIHWGTGFNSVAATYSPYRYAEQYKDMILNRYSDKLLKNKPFFLVFVNFPWFDQLVIDFDKMNEVFYRSLSRRTFMQYKHTRAKASEIIPDYIGNDTQYSLSRCLTGIIFIEDYSIERTIDKYKTFIYLNPNARNCRPSLIPYLEQLPNAMIDDFGFDNY